MKSRKSTIALLTAFGLLCGAIGAGAATGVQQIKAALNWNLKFDVDGEAWTPVDGNGKKLAPIVYNGSTYLPARAITEMMGGTINLKNGTIYLTTPGGGSDGVPYNDITDGNASSNQPSKPADTSQDKPAASSTNGKTIGTAVALGQSLTYTDPYVYGKQSYTGTYTVTVLSSKPISRDQIEKLGFKRPEDNAKVEYQLVKLRVTAKGKVNSLDDPSGTWYLSLFNPKIWGSKTADGESIIGGTTYGFDGSLNRAIDAAADYKQLSVGQSGSYTAEGDVILPVAAGKTNYLTLQLSQYDYGAYDNSFFYFKLK